MRLFSVFLENLESNFALENTLFIIILGTIKEPPWLSGVNFESNPVIISMKFYSGKKSEI